jgi:hypothetical protein
MPSPRPARATAVHPSMPSISQWLAVVGVALVATTAEGQLIFEDDFTRIDGPIGDVYLTGVGSAEPVTIITNRACSTSQGLAIVACTVADGTSVTIRQTFAASTVEGFESYSFLGDISGFPSTGNLYLAGCDGGHNSNGCRLRINSIHNGADFYGPGTTVTDVPLAVGTVYLIESVFSSTGISTSIYDGGGVLLGSISTTSIAVDLSAGLSPGFLVGRDPLGLTCSSSFEVESDSSAQGSLAMCLDPPTTSPTTSPTSSPTISPATDDCSGTSAKGKCTSGKAKSGKAKSGKSKGSSGMSASSGGKQGSKKGSPSTLVGASTTSAATSSTLVVGAIVGVVLVAAVSMFALRRNRWAQAVETDVKVNPAFTVFFDASDDAVTSPDAETKVFRI